MALVPVFQARKLITSGVWTGVDYDYPVGIDAARNAQADGYSIDCVAFVAEDQPATDYLPLLRYMKNGFHFYTTDIHAEETHDPENSAGWTPTPAAKTAYLLQSNPTPAQSMVRVDRRVSPNSQSGVAHFFCATPSVPPALEGWRSEESSIVYAGNVSTPARVDFVVDYNGNGQSTGITITGGNAEGQTVKIDGRDYVMKADDALVGYGVGNWISFQRKPLTSGAWHFADIAIVKANPNTSDSLARFDVLLSADESQLAVIDDDEDTSNIQYAYEYTLTIQDERLDRPITFDPKIINRAPAVTS